MGINEWEEIAQKAEIFVKRAGELIKESLQKQVVVEYKSDHNDLVTEVDKKVEHFLKTEINRTFPQHVILGEEGTGKDVTTLEGTVWIIDPIDGTINFVHQQRNFAISVGIYENGIGKVGIIYDVIGEELFLAKKGKGAFLNGISLPILKEASISEALIAVNSGWLLKDKRLVEVINDCRGTRSYGSAAIEMAYVAANRNDAYISLRLSPWDFAAGAIIVQEVGAKITTLTGEPINLLKASSIFVAKQGLYEQLKNDYF